MKRRLFTIAASIVLAHVIGSYLFAFVDVVRLAHQYHDSVWETLDDVRGPTLRAPLTGWKDAIAIVQDGAFLWLVAACIAYAVPFGFVGRFLKRRFAKRPANVCPVCGYNLRATPDRCPECGTEIKVKAATV